MFKYRVADLAGVSFHFELVSLLATQMETVGRFVMHFYYSFGSQR